MTNNLDTSNASSTDLIQHGLAASRSGDTDQALQWFRAACERDPKAGVPHFLIGAELAQTGDIGGAEAAYSTAVLLSPGFDMARFQLGLLQFTSGRVASALLTWQPLFGLPQTVALQRIVSGFAALAADEFDQAIALLRAGIELNRDNDALSADLSKLIARIESSQVQNAESGTSGASVSTASSSTEELAREESASVHVLLSNYRRDGPLH